MTLRRLLTLVPICTALLWAPAVPSLTGCACGPTGETDAELAPLAFTASSARIELPATVRVREGAPEIEARIPGCAGTALAAATVAFLDAAGEPLRSSTPATCRATARLSSVPAGSTIDMRVVVTLPAAAAATGEIELVTFQDVCASVGSSEIVSFGT